MNDPTPREYPSRPDAVYFYGTCLLDMLYPEAGLAAVELIERQGVRVIYPQDQTCCGQPPYNSGYRKEARAVARMQLALFKKPLPVVVPSGSCAAMLHAHFPELFRGRAEEAAAREFSARVFEWSDFMVNVLRIELEDRGPPLRVAYHPSCHLLREMGVKDPPQKLISQLARVELLPFDGAEDCCGFGGTFSIKMSHISSAMVEDKCRAVTESGAEVLVSLDAGCLMNIGGAMARSAGGRSGEGKAPVCMPLPLFLKQRIEGGSSAGARGGAGGEDGAESGHGA